MDSNIVYKIDNISSEKTESMYSCKMHRNVGFSLFFYEEREQISARLARVEVLLSQIGAETPLHLQLVSDNLDDIEKSVVRGALSIHLRSADSELVNLLADFLTHSESESEAMTASAWWPAYHELSYGDRLKFYDFVLQQLKNRDADVNSFRDFPQFAGNFYKRLDNYGAANGKFDFVFETENPDFPIEKLVSLARSNPQVRVALKNRSGVYVLPFMLKLAKTLVDQADYRFIEGKNTNVPDYFSNTERLIILNSEGDLKLAPLFDDGARTFLASNRQLDFIQIHIPSFKLKEKQLSSVKNYFAFVKTSKMNATWVRDLNAFKPVAAVDAIQYYRLN